MQHVVRWFLEGHVWMPRLLLVIPIENLLLKHSDIKIYKFIISASTKIFEHNVRACVCVCVCVCVFVWQEKVDSPNFQKGGA